METDNKGKNLKNLLIALGILILVAAAALGLWRIATKTKVEVEDSNIKPETSEEGGALLLSSLISYKLPQGWSDIECIKDNGTVLVSPEGMPKPDCSVDQENWPLSIFIDPQNTTDCNQIKVNNQQISKHTCRSIFIDGHKTLEASTEYNEQSQYENPTRVSAYYVDTGENVVKLEYVDDLTSAEDDFQEGFEELVQSVQVK